MLEERQDGCLAVVRPGLHVLFLYCAHGVSFHQDKIMLWINASATSGECPRMVAHTSFGNNLVILPTSP